MNVERISWLLPACGDRWLPSIVARAFTVEHPVPPELESILSALQVRAGPRGRETVSAADQCEVHAAVA